MPVGWLELLDFRNETTWPMQEHGRDQAQQAMQQGDGFGFKALDEWKSDERTLTEKWGTFAKYLKSLIIKND